jgi:asparagine synthase (glutamine-hydrolysing)
MCGIAGVLGEGEAAVGPMIHALSHRGPDGIRIEPVRGGAVGHARLSIIDLEGGWQPLHAAGSTVIGNGEIYNYVELIEEHGLDCATGSDFEPLLHLYAREGERAFERLRGMYAFCLIGGDGRTWLVRDPFGIKPLYMRSREGWTAFASEPRALAPLNAFDAFADVEMLALNYADKRNSLPVSAVPPGAVWEVNPGGSAGFERAPVPTQALSWGRYARGLPFTSARTYPVAPSASDDEVVAQLDAVLEDSVRVHQRSDVPYGLFLSGGIDSTSIATVMARLNSRPVTAFTCGFTGPGAKDERASAERVARALNLDWRETTFGEEDFWRVLPEVAWALDDATTDYATLPTWKLGEAAKGTLTVVLSGEGGDELFGGYGRYRRALRPRLLGGRRADPRMDAPYLTDLYRLSPYDSPVDRWEKLGKPPPGLTPLQSAQYADIVTWLPNDLLLKLDRCLMAHGLEGRTPFLDRELAAFAFPLPDRFKVRGRYGKWILRKWLERHCPAADPWARKQGFTVPVAGWIAPRAGDLARTVPQHEGLAQVCDTDAVRAVFTADALAKHRWPLLFYAVWWNIHVGGMARGEALSTLLGAR